MDKEGKSEESSRGDENYKFSECQKWANGVRENFKQRALLVKEGFKVFFDTIHSLPALGEIDMPEDLKHFSPSEAEQLTQAQAVLFNVFGWYWWPPGTIQVNNITSHKPGFQKSTQIYSADLVILTPWRLIGREGGIVFHLSYEPSEVPELANHSLECRMTGFVSKENYEREERLQRIPELDLLLTINNLTQLYGSKVSDLNWQRKSC